MDDQAPVREEWLEGLAPAQREERRALLQRLAAQGFTAEELDRAIADDRLVLLGIERVFGAVHSAEEVQRRTGVPATTLARARRMLGLPEPQAGERVFTDLDIAAAQAIKLFIDAGIEHHRLKGVGRPAPLHRARRAATSRP